MDTANTHLKEPFLSVLLLGSNTVLYYMQIVKGRLETMLQLPVIPSVTWLPTFLSLLATNTSQYYSQKLCKTKNVCVCVCVRERDRRDATSICQ